MALSFPKQLQTLRQWWAAQTDRPSRVALVGIGNELRGDDAAGVAILRRLRVRVQSGERVLLVEAGTVPENVTGPLRRFKPDLVILIDAGSFGAQPGSLRLCSAEEARGFSASAHTMPLASFARYLQEDIGCATALVLVQPEQMEFDQEMSTAVKRGVARAASGLAKFLVN